MPDPTTPQLDTTTWLHQLYGTAETGWVTLFTIDRATGRPATDWAPVDHLDQIAAAAHEREPHSCVWFGVATRTTKLDGARRGGATDCAELPGFWVDIDVAGPGHRGAGRLARDRGHAHQLVNAFPLPPTAVIDTGGGLQAWWLFDELATVDDTTLAMLAAWGTTWARLGDQHGIDIDNVFDAPRIMRLPGTTNRKENLARPVTATTVAFERRYGLDDLDQHLDAPPAPPQHRTASQVPYIGPERPGDAYSLRHTGGDLLARHGFTLARTDRTGDEHWVRPGKDAREGSSATVYAEDGHTTIWSSTVTSQWPALEVNRPYDPFGLYTCIEHSGDFATATRTLRDQGYGGRYDDGIADLIGQAAAAMPSVTKTPTPAEQQATAEQEEQQRADWAPIDLAAILAEGHQPPNPTILAVAGGPPLLYPGRTNAIFGESGGGKTWVALAAIRDELAAGNTTIFIDLEDSPHGILSRLTALGVTHDAITGRFIYLAPQTGWGPIAQASVAALLEEHTPTLVVLDSTGEAMAAQGVKGNDDDDVARWFWAFPRWIARRGPAVIVIDHLPKDSSGSPTHQIGSQRKKAAIDGASYRVDITTPPSRTTDGVLKLIVAKDRNGARALNETAALIHLAHDLLGHVTLTLTAPDAPSLDHRGNPRRTVYMERISRWLEAHPGSSKGEIETAVAGKATHIREAFATLHDEGHVDRHSYARKHSWIVTQPYREASDPRVPHVIPQTAPHDVSVDDADDVSAHSSHSSPTRPPLGDEPPKTYSSRPPSPVGGGPKFVPPENPTKSAPQDDHSSPGTDDLTADESLFLDNDPPEEM